MDRTGLPSESGDTVYPLIKGLLRSLSLIFLFVCVFCFFEGMSNTTNTVVFKINGTEHTVVNPEPYMTLNEYIRGQPNLKGTKKNCGQAGCGVCTVVASYPDPGSGKVVNVSLNSCVHPLISCNGQEITTVEGVGTMDNLHPVQERLADNNGSQCGFCTSGMVCTMYGLLQKNSSPTQGQIVEALDGNLCRCTGYRPIVAAFTTFGSDYKNIPEQTQGRCCSDVRETFPDIEELGVLVKEKYNHGKYAKAKSFPKVSKEVVIAGRENNWVTVTTMQALYTALSSAPAVGTRLVVGNTSSGIYPMPVPKLYINIQPVKDLYGIGVNGSALIIGANETITSISDYLEASLAKLPPKFTRMYEFIKRIASFNIRNVGSWAGNLMMSNQNDFASDLYTMLCAANGTITVSDTTGATTQVACTGFRTYDMSKKVVMSVSLPVDGSDIFFIEKVALRSRFAHSYVNMGASVKLDGTTCTSISLVVAGFPGAGVVLTKTQAAIVGKDVTSQSTMFDAMTVMQAELQPLNTNPHDTEYRATVVNNLLYKLFLNMQPSLPANLQSAIAHIKRPVSTGHQTYQNPGDASEKPISYPIPKLMEKEQTCGKAVYSSDEPVLPGTLYAAPVYSTVGLGTITSIDSSDALSLPGVVAFFSSKDLKNPDFKWGGVYQDEPLFASDEITCAGQLIGLVVAETQLTADMGSRLVNVEYDTSKGKPILNIDDAIAQNSFYTGVPGLNFPQKTGDVDKGFSASDHVITGSAYMGSQLHFQMEPMNMYAIPEEGGSLKIIGSFQFQSFIQQLTAGVLQMPQGKITVSTRRIGGAYGSKITRPGGMAAAVAVAASKLNTPVKTDMRIEFQNDMMGKRNQFKTDYKIGFNKDGKINAIQVMIYQQSGAFFDIDNFSINACVDTISNCYMIPNWSINGQLCKTNIPAQTSVRGPGWASGCYLSDVMLENVANYLNMDPLDVKKANLYQPGDLTPYGQPLKYFPLNSMLTQLQSTSNYAQRKQEIDQYNQENTWTKRGIAFVPARFNVNNSHDPFSSLVVGYGDGTLQVSVGGIECGQGLNTKVAQAVAMVRLRMLIPFILTLYLVSGL